MTLADTYTSTGQKMFFHQEAMANLRNGKGQPVVTHVMLTDVCNHTCAFCSVQARAGDHLPFENVVIYLDTLVKYGLKAVIFSGGGNPILYKDGEANFNNVVNVAHGMGLEIGLITNGMPLRRFTDTRHTAVVAADRKSAKGCTEITLRDSWGTVRPDTLDKLTWVRISMAGLDHCEREVYVPDIDPAKTALGFSYVAHDIYNEPADPHHGKVSRPADLLSGNRDRAPNWCFEERMDELTHQIAHYIRTYKPRYVRLLPNCLEPQLIQARCAELRTMAERINALEARDVVFVQHKPPAAPKACFLGYIHPVLNCDGYVYPCDSCVLNEAAGHQFANPWRVCRWDEVAQLYERPVRSLIADPARTCPGCVFSKSNELLKGVVDGSIDTTPPPETPEHVNFV